MTSIRCGMICLASQMFFSSPVNSSFVTNSRKSSANIANIFKVMPAKRLIQLRRTYRNSKIALAQPIRKGPRGGWELLPRVMHLQTQDVSRLCDRVLHRCEWFRVTNSNINWLQRSNACRTFRKIGVEIYKNFESPKEPDKEVAEIPVDDCKQVGPWTLCEVWGDVVADYSPTNLHHQAFQGCPVDWDGNEAWRQVWLPAELSEVSRHLVLSGLLLKQ